MAMLVLLEQDLIKQITELEVEEKEAQVDYEKFIKDSSEKRALDSKTVEDQEGTKAELEAELHKAVESKKTQEKDLATTKSTLAGLHDDCDFLLKNYDVRKQARAEEGDALEKAKAVLAGADTTA